VIRRDLRTREGGHAFAVIPAPRESGESALNGRRARSVINMTRGMWPLIVLDRIFMHLHINYKARTTVSPVPSSWLGIPAVGICLFPETISRT